MREIVNGLLVRGGLILLAKRSPRRKAYPGTWSFPGGHLEPAETPEAGLVRELREELGVTPTTCLRLGLLADPNAGAEDPITYHLYVVTAWQGGEPAIADDEHTELGWFEPMAASSLPDLALEEYRPLLRRLAAAPV